MIAVKHFTPYMPRFETVKVPGGLAAIFPGLAGTPWLADPDLAMGILVLTDVWHWAPYMTFMCLGGLASVPRETEEAARIDGASNLRIIFGIVLPQMKGVLAVTAILKTIFALFSETSNTSSGTFPTPSCVRPAMPMRMSLSFPAASMRSVPVIESIAFLGIEMM